MQTAVECIDILMMSEYYVATVMSYRVRGSGAKIRIPHYLPHCFSFGSDLPFTEVKDTVSLLTKTLDHLVYHARRDCIA